MFIKNVAAAGLAMALLTSPLTAQESAVPEGVPHLNHVFMIMMENHSYSEVLNNPNAPFINQLAHSANIGTSYFGVAHPSFTNYIEVLGGSNFGLLNDHTPDWHSTTCTPNIISGITAFDTSATPPNCPIYGKGTDAATPAIDYTNEASSPAGVFNIDGIQSIPASHEIVGKSIGHQLVAAGLSWKSYQESLPITGANNVNFSDGVFTDATDFTAIKPTLTPPLTSNDLVDLYAAKHNPFVYFRDIEEGYDPNNNLRNIVSFEGQRGLFADLATGHVPSFSFIAPNQCNDQHGRGNAGAFCNYDPNSNGTQAGLNPALIKRGDVEVERLVKAIKASPAWKEGRNAIVILWDENDYSAAPETNQVLLIVDTNYGSRGLQSNVHYTHYSLLRSIEAGFGIPCLNHACDSNVKVMTDLFSGSDKRRNNDDDDNEGN